MLRILQRALLVLPHVEYRQPECSWRGAVSNLVVKEAGDLHPKLHVFELQRQAIDQGLFLQEDVFSLD